MGCPLLAGPTRARDGRGPDLDSVRVFYRQGLTWRALAPVAAGGGLKAKESLQAGSGGGAEARSAARAPHPCRAFVYCSARGRRRGSAADVTRRAH